MNSARRELALFSSEIIADSLADMNKIAVLGGPDKNTELARKGLLIAELALSGEVQTLLCTEEQNSATISRAMDQFVQEKQRVVNFSQDMCRLVPSAQLAVDTELKRIMSEGYAHTRRKILTTMLGMAGLPEVFDEQITNDEVAMSLLDTFAEYEPRNTTPAERARVSEQEIMVSAETLIRILQKTTVRDRMVEFFTSCQGTGVDVATLTEAAFFTGMSRSDTRKNQKIIVHSMLNPLQSSGQKTFQELADVGLSLQVGEAQPIDVPDCRPTRVFRSIVTAKFDPAEHTGLFRDEKMLCEWKELRHLQTHEEQS